MDARERRFVSVMAAAALALRLIRLGGQSLWVDEVLTLSVSIPRPGLNIWDYLKYNIHGPLHALIVYLIHFVSMGDAWLRFPSAVFGALGVVYFYRWIRIWLGGPIARWASLLLLLNPLHVYYSQELRNYSLLFFFAVFASYQFHRLMAEESRGRFAKYVVGVVGGVLSNFTMAFYYAVHSLLYLFRRGAQRRGWVHWTLVSLVIAILISPWIYRVYAFIDVPKLVTPVMPGEIPVGERLRGETTVGVETIPYALYTYSVGFSLGPSLRELHRNPSAASVFRHHAVAVVWSALLFGFLALRGLYELIRKRARWVQVTLYLTVPMVLTLLLCWQNAKAFNARYVLLGLPPYLCCVAAGITSQRRAVRRLFAGLVVLTLLVSLGNYFFNGTYARDNVRAAARFVAAHASDEDCVLAPTVREVFTHYYHGPCPMYAVYTGPGMPLSRRAEQLVPMFANCDRVWYVRAREWATDPDGMILAALEGRYHEMERHDYEGVTLLLFQR
jgi:4-amino-4-deoxy-L-arabinose transferase-like glycosyltransferase